MTSPPLTVPAVILHTVALPAEGGGAPSWVHLVPAGETRGRDGRTVRLDDPAAVIAATALHAGGQDLPIDYDHGLFTEAHDKRAAGWIVELQSRADGIWGRVDWTEAGAAAVTSREYRYLSPAILDGANGAVVAVLGAAVTNTPNLPQLASLNTAQQEPTAMDLATRLRQALALDAAADDDAIVAAVSTVQGERDGHRTALHSVQQRLGAAAADSAGIVAAIDAMTVKTVPIDTHQAVVSELAELRRTRAEEAAAAEVDRAIEEGRVVPAAREAAIRLHAADAEAFRKAIEVTPPLVTPATGEAGTPDDTTRQPAAETHRLTAHQLAVCHSMGLDPKAYAAELAHRAEVEKAAPA